MIATIYRLAAQAGFVHPPDRNALQRARRALARNRAEPGDCAGDLPLLAGLAVAEAEVGRGAGWLPVVQRKGVAIAQLIEPRTV